MHSRLRRFGVAILLLSAAMPEPPDACPPFDVFHLVLIGFFKMSSVSTPAVHKAIIPIAGLVAFYNEKVDLTVDGVRLERPQTTFS